MKFITNYIRNNRNNMRIEIDDFSFPSFDVSFLKTHPIGLSLYINQNPLATRETVQSSEKWKSIEKSVVTDYRMSHATDFSSR